MPQKIRQTPTVPVQSQVIDANGRFTQEVTNFLRQLADFSDRIEDVEVLARTKWSSPAEALDVITGGGGGGAGMNWVTEVPSGTMNSVNKAFTISYAPSAGSFSLYLNGVEQMNYWATLSGTTITYSVAPRSYDQMLARYTH